MQNRYIGSIILEGAATAEDAIIIGENKGNGVKHRIIAEGTLQDADILNRNKRIYAKEDLFPEINGPRMKELINTRNMKGEAGHPLDDSLIRQQTIDPTKVCVEYLKIWTEGNKVKAHFKGTQNDLGDYFNADLADGCKPAFSLRALGGIENINGNAYVKGIKIITYDHVIYPSHKVAYTTHIVSESSIIKNEQNEYIVPENDPGRIITLRESDARTVINSLHRESANLDAIVNTFDGIMDKISLLNESTILLTTRYGDRICVNLENHIDNLIMEFASKV